MLSCVMFDTFISFLRCNFPVSLSSISVSIMQLGQVPKPIASCQFWDLFSIIIVLLGVYFSTCVKCPFPCLFIYSMGLEMRDIYAAGKSWSHVNKPEGDRITLLLPSVSVYIMVW